MGWLTATCVTEDGDVLLRALPVADLVSAGLSSDDHSRYDYAGYLHLRDDRETFEAAERLCRSPEATWRSFGVDILAKLGGIAIAGGDRVVEVPVQRRQFRGPAAAIVLDLAATERDEQVLESIASAVGHLREPRGIAYLGRLRGHPAVMVRWAVVMALPVFADTDDTALGFLVELTADPDPRNRDWACFGLYQLGRDTPEVRTALAARITDDDRITRAEALRALAKLGDERAAEPLREALAEADPDAPLDVLEEALRLLEEHPVRRR